MREQVLSEWPLKGSGVESDPLMLSILSVQHWSAGPVQDNCAMPQQPTGSAIYLTFFFNLILVVFVKLLLLGLLKPKGRRRDFTSKKDVLKMMAQRQWPGGQSIWNPEILLQGQTRGTAGATSVAELLFFWFCGEQHQVWMRHFCHQACESQDLVWLQTSLVFSPVGTHSN